MKLKYIFLFIYIALGTQGMAQNPFQNTTWTGNRIIGLKDFKFSPALDSLRLDTLNITHPYGYITTFKESTFLSYNQGGCGNECRLYVSGTYQVEANTIRFFVENIKYQKMCSDTPEQTVRQALGTFVWIKQGNGFLIRSEK